MSRPVLVVGGRGQLGRALAHRLRGRRPLVVAGRGEPGSRRLDLQNATSIRDVLEQVRPSHVVNCAAFTAVDQAETDSATCEAVNHEGVRGLADACAAVDAALLHISTDYVFDGEASRPYREDDPTSPLNGYGASKLAGERAALASDAACLVIRTSWLYSLQGPSFLTTMLRLLAERPEVDVVADQIGSPTWTGDLADVLVALLDRWAPASPDAARGILHATAQGWTSWHGFARAIARHVGSTSTVRPIPTRAWPTPARRPAWSVLDGSRLATTFGLELPTWQSGLLRCLRPQLAPRRAMRHAYGTTFVQEAPRPLDISI